MDPPTRTLISRNASLTPGSPNFFPNKDIRQQHCVHMCCKHKQCTPGNERSAEHLRLIKSLTCSSQQPLEVRAECCERAVHDSTLVKYGPMRVYQTPGALEVCAGLG